MEQLEETHGESATIDAIGIVVAVDTPDQSAVHYRFVDGEGGDLANYKMLGLLAELDNGLKGQR